MATLIISAICLLLLIVVVVLATTLEPPPDPPEEPAPLKLLNSVLASRSGRVFRSFTDADTEEIIAFLMQQTRLNLSPASEANLSSSYVFTIDNYPTEKTATTAYLDETTDVEPSHRAEVTLFNGKRNTVEKYLVSPIPHPTDIEPISSSLKQKRAMWRARPVCTTVEKPVIDQVIHKELEFLQSVISQSFTLNCENIAQCLSYSMLVRSTIWSRRRQILVVFYMRDEEMGYKYPLSFYMVLLSTVDHYGFEVTRIHYNGRVYTSSLQLLNKYKNDPSILYSVNNITGSGGSYHPTWAEQGEHFKTPTLLEPNRQRFLVSGHYVEWLG